MEQTIERDPFRSRKEKQEKEEKEHALKRAQLLADARALLALPAGQRFLRWIESLQPTTESTYTGNADGYKREGRRQVTREVRALLEDADPSLIPWLDRQENDK